ncbi:MAG: NAD(P)H-dependent oxidoreductase [Pseudomonadota bacterium]
MRTLIVHAHHEPTSFNAAMTNAAVAALEGAGHEVLVSDLYAMKWDPVSDRRNFRRTADATRLDQQVEERLASSDGRGFAPELEEQIARLEWADHIVFQFPIWWLGMPAILKGWIDRVFAVGVAYGGGRWFDRGRLAGKRAQLSLTTGGGAAPYSADGVYGPIEPILFPITHGILGFVGFDVLEPHVVYGPQRMTDAERAAALDEWRARVLTLDTAPVLPKLRSDDYENFVRKAVAA